MLPPTPSSLFLGSYFSDNSSACFTRTSTAVGPITAGNLQHPSVVHLQSTFPHKVSRQAQFCKHFMSNAPVRSRDIHQAYNELHWPSSNHVESDVSRCFAGSLNRVTNDYRRAARLSHTGGSVWIVPPENAQRIHYKVNSTDNVHDNLTTNHM
jgi:hypothetical protein